MISIKVPPLGESIVEATVARWLKKEGDSVAAGDTLVELETDKVTVEVPALKGGVLARQVKHEGDVVAVDEVLGEIRDLVQAALDGVGVEGRESVRRHDLGVVDDPYQRMVDQPLRDLARRDEMDGAHPRGKEMDAPHRVAQLIATDEPGGLTDVVSAAMLPGEPVNLEQISERSGLSVAELLPRLLDLELAGEVKREPGGRFVRVGRTC